MPERLPCLVPFCRRTRPNDGTFSDWICGPHWRGVSFATKARKRQMARRLDRLRRAERDLALALSATNAAWRRCRAEAIEAACGISATSGGSDER